MAVILEQRFPLGRFHATRWRENIFEDKYGEWPPSPWRMLRTLAARWFQYTRETGDGDTSVRDELLSAMASENPEFYLPESTWRPNRVPRQYHRTGVEWTAKGAKDPAYKKAMSTLVPDPFRAISPDDCVYWFWQSVSLSLDATRLLDDLSRRVTYFGRAESFCRLKLLDEQSSVTPNCWLNESKGRGQPVLTASTTQKLDFESLFAATDDKRVAGLTSPPSAVWQYAKLPEKPRLRTGPSARFSSHPDTNCVQFAIGGRVYPTLQHWTRITARFRGRVLKNIARSVSDGNVNDFASLNREDQARFSGLSGKDRDGQPLTDHSHAYFCIYPDDSGNPTRLVCYRDSPFEPEEFEAILAASNHPISWKYQNPKNDPWHLRLVPLPTKVARPDCFNETVSAKIWESVTPFVPQGNRHRFRKNGKLRPGETPERLLEKLVAKRQLPPCTIERLDNHVDFVGVHETMRQRKQRSQQSTRNTRQGFRFRLTFDATYHGPIILGHSDHFGLGMFAPTTATDSN